MTRDEAYEELGNLGYSGALEDRLNTYFGATTSVEDAIFAVDSTAGGVENYLGKQVAFREPSVWDDTEVWDDTRTWEDYPNV